MTAPRKPAAGGTPGPCIDLRGGYARHGYLVKALGGSRFLVLDPCKGDPRTVAVQLVAGDFVVFSDREFFRSYAAARKWEEKARAALERAAVRGGGAA